jgi:hypothetical protein
MQQEIIQRRDRTHSEDKFDLKMDITKGLAMSRQDRLLLKIGDAKEKFGVNASAIMKF